MASLATTVTATVTHTVTSASASSTLRAAAQGGIFEHQNPTTYSSSNPIILFIIQAGIILIFCRLLHYPLSLMRQPRVIAEVIGGILLGPSVMGHVPGFTKTIFPTASIPNLTLVANIGLVLFLFLVGLEVDLRWVKSNWKAALSVSAAGMILPFGLGCASAWGLYNQFRDEPGTVAINFGTYMLFIGVAMAITAFPVLCRILTELKLLSTPVGVIVLSAGVGNDLVGWILLALCVALVNASSGITALYILLVAVGYALFLVFAVRPAFMWVLRRTRSLQDGPPQSVIVLTLLIALVSAFFTGIIGVHPIFGAFMAGLICPHEGGFAIKVTEKLEDLVTALFLPLYFALSGLSTNLGLLDTGITWGYVIAVIVVAFCGKFFGGTLAAKLNGMVWRESFTIGVMMSCKGLVELIVLNIGKNAKILSDRTFTIFVVMALVTTFATTPLTAWLYPPWYQRKIEAWKRGEIDWDGAPLTHDGASDADGILAEKIETAKIRNLMVYLRLDNMPTLLALVSLLGGKPSESIERKHPSSAAGSPRQETLEIGTDRRRPIGVHGVRLLELTERSSSVMRVAEVDEYSIFDPVLNAFRVLGQLYNLAVSGEVAVVPESSFAETITTKAVEESSDLLLLPWSETGSMSESQTITTDSVRNRLSSDAYSAFIASALFQTQCNTAVFVNKGFSGSLKQRPSTLQRSMSALSMRSHRDATLPIVDRSHHIFLPFFGGADSRVALRLVLQLAENPEVTATVVHYSTRGQSHDGGDENASSSSGQVVEQTVLAQPKTATSSGTMDTDNDAVFFATMQRSLPADLAGRVILTSVNTSSPVDDAVNKAAEEVGQNPRNGGDLVVLGRQWNSNEQQQGTVGYSSGTTAGGCLGTAAQKMLESTVVKGSLLVVQARRREKEE